MSYLKWDKINISDFSDTNIDNLYQKGYLFTRVERGEMQQTRSVRIDLKNFEESSENRRILKKAGDIKISHEPIPYIKYTWEIGKLAKDFYDSRNANFSANKIKEIMTDSQKTNFNSLFVFNDNIGYCINRETSKMIHYCYPFYKSTSKDFGLAMILESIKWAKRNNKKYLYLGSIQRPNDSYKLQFAGLEWFDGEKWSDDTKKAKEVLSKNEIV